MSLACPRSSGPLGSAWLALVLSVCCFLPDLVGQTLETPETPKSPTLVVQEEIEALRALTESHRSLNARLQQQRAVLPPPDDPAHEEQRRRLTELEGRLLELEEDLATAAAGVTTAAFLGTNDDEAELDLQQELARLLSPLVSQVRNLSRRTRVLQELQAKLNLQEHRAELARNAILNLQQHLADLVTSGEPSDSELSLRLNELESDWQARLGEAEARSRALQRQIAEADENGDSVWSLVAESAWHFVFTRGLTIFLAILAFIGVYFGLRLSYLHALKMVPLYRMERLSFFRRLFGLLNQGLSAALALMAALAVLYASGDWLLGAVAMLVLLAIALAAKSGITRYFDQVRMLLNLGSAREDECVLIDGVPWRVGPINLQTRLTNPCIGSPGLRLPLDQLMRMTSRPLGLDEAWFPCRTGDFILMDGKILARVDLITPDFVSVNFMGGAVRQIPTPAFVAMQPANLSGGFVVAATLGLDYAHQGDITGEIPRLLSEDLRAGLLESVPPEHLLDVRVEFKEAASSSLNLLLVARCRGAVADRYLELGRLLQRLAVESCSRHGWNIPFPQMVLHTPSKPEITPAEK